MEVASSHVSREREGSPVSRSRSLSPLGRGGRARSGSVGCNVPLSVSHTYHPENGEGTRSGSTSLSSSRKSSISSCGDLFSAIDNMAAELQQLEREASINVACEEESRSEVKGEADDNTPQNSIKSRPGSVKSLGSLKGQGSLEQRKVRVTDLAEKEKLLNDCKTQIQVLSRNNHQMEKKIALLEAELTQAKAYKVPAKSVLKQWPKTRTFPYDFQKQIHLDDVYFDPSEIVQAFLESERKYVAGLTLLHVHYEQPMKMLSSLKPDVLSSHQLNLIFLNTGELLLLHKCLQEELSQIIHLSECAQVDKLFETFERTFPSFSLYNCFMEPTRHQAVQRELKTLNTKNQFVQLLSHCEQNCNGVQLHELLQLPTERLIHYHDMLTHFLDARVRALPEDATKRTEQLRRYLRSLKYNLQEEKSEWDHTMKKIQLLQKIAPDGPIPLEIFDSDVQLLKQGPLIQVVDKKEIKRVCFLFNSYFAMGETVTTSQLQYRILEHGMIPLHGAQLHKCVDVEGQIIQPDLQSGRQEDRLAFRLSFVNNESLFFRVAKPNEWKSWIETLEKTIAECQLSQGQLESEDGGPLFEADYQPKIAAASLEKLFQQLTSPQMFKEDFIEVFLMTHSCFTTSKDVLTALLNCIKSPDDAMSDSSSQTSGSVAFPFNMDDISESSLSASPSLNTINTDSEEGGSPSTSPTVARRSTTGAGYSPASPSPAVGALCRNTNNLEPNARKAIHSGTSLMSTSDSDTSPHTSALIVDQPITDQTSTTDGWTAHDDDKHKKSANRKARVLSAETHTEGVDEIDSGEHYMKLFPRAQVHLNSVESEGSEGEEDVTSEGGGGVTPRQSSLTGSLEVVSKPRVPRVAVQRSLSESQFNEAVLLDNDDDDIIGKDVRRSSKMNKDLDELSNMMQMLTESLTVDFDPSSSTQSSPSHLSASIRRGSKESTRPEANKDSGVFEEAEPESGEGSMCDGGEGSVKRRSNTISETVSRSLVVSSTLSISEPDLSEIGLDEENDSVPPPLPPRDYDMPSTPTRKSFDNREGRGLMRRGSDRSLLSASLNFGPCPESPFHHGSAMTASPTHSISSSSNTTLERKEKTERSFFSKRSSKKTSNGGRKKADTFSGRNNNGGKASASLQMPTKSSTLQPRSGTSPGGGSVTPDAIKSPKRSKWKNIVSRKFLRSPSLEGKELQGLKGRRSQSIPNIKKAAVHDVRKGSLETVDGTAVSPGGRQWRTSTCAGQNSVNLVAKIFSVLNCWQTNFFEDFLQDAELKEFLEDFLQGLLSKSNSTNESLECTLAHKLIDDLEVQEVSSTIPPPSAPFPDLLLRVVRISPDILKSYEWDHPEKLRVGCEIDLSRPVSKESSFLRIVAEQLTLMEFAVYAVVQRRELLNCNWKKADKENLAPNLSRLIRRTNEMTSWVSTEILSRDTPSLRAKVIEHFIQIATYCFAHNDMHCSLNITIALSSACIKCLRQTWSEVDKKYRHRFEKLKEQTDYQGRCKKMREKLEEITKESREKTKRLPNALPYIGAYLDQIYSLENSSKTYCSDGLVNFAKMTKLSAMIKTALQYQHSYFKFEPRLDVMAYVTSAKRLSENDLYELSMKLEPSAP